MGEKDILAALSPKVRIGAERIIADARKQGHILALDKMAEVVDGRYRIIENRPLVVRETHNQDGVPISEGLARTLDLYLDSLADDRKHLIDRTLTDREPGPWRSRICSGWSSCETSWPFDDAVQCQLIPTIRTDGSFVAGMGALMRFQHHRRFS